MVIRAIRNLFYLVCFLGILFCVGIFLYAKKLEKDYQLTDETLTGALWQMPARVYARPLDLYVGKKLNPKDLVTELKLLGYHQVNDPTIPKTYAQKGNKITYYAEAFNFGGEQNVPARRIEIIFQKNEISDMTNISDFTHPAFERLNPILLASIYPNHLQDRSLVKLDEVPPLLIDTLIHLEDKRFWTHLGFDLKGIVRAAYLTVTNNGSQQGASTLTQQFIKNHYLTNERTISRKIKEILMAVILEFYSDKRAILEGYLNEIYLGQDGKRAIHGFGLASEYYFDKKIADINLHEIALLVALVREPGLADPHKHPEYALNRRNFIIEQMVANNLISEELGKMAQQLPLDVLPKGSTSQRTRFPEFVDLVQMQLNQQYTREALTKEGLTIITTLDPIIQMDMQKRLNQAVRSLPKPKGVYLQSASVVVESATGAVIAIIAGREVENAEIHGFNRAVSAQRQVGSTIKPAIYLSALEYPNRYTVSTIIDGSPLDYQGWKPKDYGGGYAGSVSLYMALVKSRNVPTARIALDLGMNDIIRRLESLGARKDLPPYPSLSLGAVGMTPFELAQIYETFANGGQFTPLISIRQISTPSGEILPPIEREPYQAIFAGPHYLITSIMQDIPKKGTATGMPADLKKFTPAGKTGTTDKNRDSWFAGFTGNYLNVVWVGTDDNQPTGLTGGKGALRVWSTMMQGLDNTKLELEVPDEIEFANIDLGTGLRAGQYCAGVKMPFLVGTAPFRAADCAPPEEMYFDDPVYYNPAGFESIPVQQNGGTLPVGTQTPITEQIAPDRIN